MIDIKRSHLIVATAAPLGIVLFAAAIVLSRGSSPIQSAPDAESPTATGKKTGDRSGKGARKLADDGTKTLAVSAEGIDRISTTLDGFGAGYRYQVIDDETLINPALLGRFKVVFLTCVGGTAGEPPEDLPKVLREYVSNGGTLYASDLRYDTLAAAFPDLVDRPSVAQGIPQDMQGEITSPELREWLGHDITLHFKSAGWRPAAFRGDDVSVLLKGQLKTTAGVVIDAPLAVRFPIGKGTVIFTSFHSEGRVSGDEANLMRFLVLKTVTSAPEARVTESLADAGFSTGAIRVAAADAGPPPAYHVYHHAKAGPLRFRLEPARPGARLRLEVVGPKGKVTIKDGGSTLAIDLPNAAAGQWQFRAAAESVPYPAFPAVMVVGTNGGSSDSTTAKMNPALVETGGNVRFDIVNPGNKAVVKEARPLRLAVTKPMFDDMGRLLDALGEGYRYAQVEHTAPSHRRRSTGSTSFFSPACLPERLGTSVARHRVTPRSVLRGGEARNHREIQADNESVHGTWRNHLRLRHVVRVHLLLLTRTSSGGRFRSEPFARDRRCRKELVETRRAPRPGRDGFPDAGQPQARGETPGALR